MRILRRVAHGAEAGLLAGAGIAALFFALDLVQLSPLSTPVALSTGLWGPLAPPADGDTLARVAGYGVLGARVVGFSLVHLVVFAVIGAVGAFVIDGASFWASLGGGVVYGTVAGTGVFYAGRLLADAPLSLELMGPTAVVLANAMGGAILGMGLHLAQADLGDPGNG